MIPSTSCKQSNIPIHASEATEVVRDNFIPTFKIQGQIYRVRDNGF